MEQLRIVIVAIFAGLMLMFSIDAAALPVYESKYKAANYEDKKESFIQYCIDKGLVYIRVKEVLSERAEQMKQEHHDNLKPTEEVSEICKTVGFLVV